MTSLKRFIFDDYGPRFWVFVAIPVVILGGVAMAAWLSYTQPPTHEERIARCRKTGAVGMDAHGCIYDFRGGR